MKKKPRRKAAPRKLAREVSVEAAWLEVALGDDGLLRGKPEPVVVLAAYWLGAELRTLGRAVTRFRVKGPDPSLAERVEPVSVGATAPGEGRLLALAVALEEDSGRDVARLYGLLEDISALRFWLAEDAVPSPRALAELALPRDRGAVARAVHVLEGTRDLADRAAEDEVLGAFVIALPCDGEAHELRLRFRSKDEKNDWTVGFSGRSHACAPDVLVHGRCWR